MDDSSQPIEAEAAGPRTISPTDVSQFIRLNQSKRYLYLRLRERGNRAEFFQSIAAQGLKLQSIPPMLTRSGAKFERQIQQELSGNNRVRTVNLEDAAGSSASRGADNELVVALAKGLHADETLFVFQARLVEDVAGWVMRGDVDILRFERGAAGELDVMIADMKASTNPKVEHRLQVAFYQRMVEALLEVAGVAHRPIRTAILYRGDQLAPESLMPAEQQLRDVQREAAQRLFLTSLGFLEIIEDQQEYLQAVHDMVTGPDSAARAVLTAAEGDVPYHLSYLCDGCLYNSLCMKWSAERDDLSLVPFMSEVQKQLLHAKGIKTVRELAVLKEFSAGERERLVAAPGKTGLVRELANNRQIGPQLDELVHRARSYRRSKGDDITSLSYIPGKGWGTLPACDATHNPNLVRIYIDAQHDYLENRAYLLGALVVAAENGEVTPARRRSIVRMAEHPPQSSEAEGLLLVEWIDATLRAAVELAVPDAEGTAPLHLIFFNRFGQKILLDALSRHLSPVLGTTPLYDFITQLAGFESPVASYLEEELRERKNYPLVAQSLQAVAKFIGFDWNAPLEYTRLFHTRLFDDRRTMINPESGEEEWYTSNSRFNSQIPLEYAYAAWNDLEAPPQRGRDLFADYRGRNCEELLGFQERRLEAIELIANQFKGDPYNKKPGFKLPDLPEVINNPRDLAHALLEFVLIERHVDMAAWKGTLGLPAERRVLMGETLIARYVAADQLDGVADKNADNERRRLLEIELRAAYFAAKPNARNFMATKEQKEAFKWSMEATEFVLRLDGDGLDTDIDGVLGLTTMRVGERVVIYPKSERVVDADGVVREYTPWVWKVLSGTLATVQAIGADGLVRVKIEGSPGGAHFGGFIFGSNNRPFDADTVYALDPDASSWSDYYAWMVTKQLSDLAEGKVGGMNALFERLTQREQQPANWPPVAVAGQVRFLAGLDALREAGALHDFESSKRDYIGGYGDAPILLVQGPPGTGKSYSTAFAIFARMQGAVEAGLDYRVFISCHTHAAIDVLLDEVAKVQEKLEGYKQSHPQIFANYFSEALLAARLFRVAGQEDAVEAEDDDAPKPEPRIVQLARDDTNPPKDGLCNAEVISSPAARLSVSGITPNGVYRLINVYDKRSKSGLFTHHFCDCLVLDEASQMNLPEAIMAALALKSDGQLVAVGDHRQMAPIIKHDWDAEPRRTFREYKSYQALFSHLLEMPTTPPIPVVRFEESFRLHAAMAEFLRATIYQQDGIAYHSQQTKLLELPVALQERLKDNPFVAAVLDPQHPIIVVVHDEKESQTHNRFEQGLIVPLMQALADAGLDPEEGMGVVVPHRAQRADLQEQMRGLMLVDSDGAGTAVRGHANEKHFIESVDVVERFQGDERKAIVISATESDPNYLLVAGKFLFEPTRLTVAISRAKSKMVLVASRQVFTTFSADEQTFQNALLWKRLLRDTCTVPLWAGEIEGTRVEVWGNKAQEA